MLTTKDIISAIEAEPSPMQKGRLAAMKRFKLDRTQRYPVTHPQFMRDMLAVDPRDPITYVHPEQRVQPRPLRHGEEFTVSAVDIAWLQRLPHDPAQVTFDDAVQLAQLSGAVSKLRQPSEHRLLWSMWAPVKAIHDRKATEAALAQAQQPLPPVPSSALGALADAIAAEVPELRDDEVLSRAHSDLNAALERRAAARAKRVADAQRRLEEINAAETQRTAVVA